MSGDVDLQARLGVIFGRDEADVLTLFGFGYQVCQVFALEFLGVVC